MWPISAIMAVFACSRSANWHESINLLKIDRLITNKQLANSDIWNELEMMVCESGQLALSLVLLKTNFNFSIALQALVYLQCLFKTGWDVKATQKYVCYFIAAL